MPSRAHYLGDAAYRRNQEASRRAKARRTGQCIDCGSATRYNGVTVNGPSPRCSPCAKKHVGQQRRGSGEVMTRVLDALQDGPLGRSDLLAVTGRSHGHLSQPLARLLRYGLIVRVSQGVYALPERQP